MEAKLTVVAGKANKKTVALKLPAILGRSREAALTIAHPMVSRQHCELCEQRGLVRIRDLGSLNGTYVGKSQITEVNLLPGDEFAVGPLTFRIDYEKPEQEDERTLDLSQLADDGLYSTLAEKLGKGAETPAGSSTGSGELRFADEKAQV